MERKKPAGIAPPEIEEWLRTGKPFWHPVGQIRFKAEQALKRTFKAGADTADVIRYNEKIAKELIALCDEYGRRSSLTSLDREDLVLLLDIGKHYQELLFQPHMPTFIQGAKTRKGQQDGGRTTKEKWIPFHAKENGGLKYQKQGAEVERFISEGQIESLALRKVSIIYRVTPQTIRKAWKRYRTEKQ